MEISNKHKDYKFDNHLVYSCQYHVIFCPKYRRRVLDDKISIRLKEVFMQTARKRGFDVLEQEIMEDHVHLLLSVNPKMGIHKVVSILKGESSHVLKKEFPHLKSRLPCLWTHSKFISSVGEVSLETVKKYIEAQKNV